MSSPADGLAAGWQDEPPLEGASPPEGGGHFVSLLSGEASAAGGAGGQDEDHSYAADLNLDQIVAATSGGSRGA